MVVDVLDILKALLAPIVAGAVLALIIGLFKKADGMVLALNAIQRDLSHWTEIVKGATQRLDAHETRLSHLEASNDYWRAKIGGRPT